MGQPGRVTLTAHRFRTFFEIRDQLRCVIHRLRQLIGAANVERFGEREKVGRKLIERALRERAESFGGIGFEEMRAAVDGVHRLATTRFAGIPAHKLFVRLLQRGDYIRQGVV